MDFSPFFSSHFAGHESPHISYSGTGCSELYFLTANYLNCRAGMAEVRCLPATRREDLLRQPFPPYKKTDSPLLTAGRFSALPMSADADHFISG